MKSDITKIKSKYISLGIKKAQNLYITADFGKIIGKENLNVETLKKRGFLECYLLNEIIVNHNHSSSVKIYPPPLEIYPRVFP